MAEQRVLFSNVVKNQVPAYIREGFPLLVQFLEQYYVAQEYQGAPVDLIQNIDKYIKLNENTNLVDSVILGTNADYNDTTINVDLTKSPTGTIGFPDTYGILKINDEIITYTGKTSSSFTGCIRGFSGVTSYKNENKPEELVFSTSSVATHESGATIENLSVLFLNEFLTKLKRQITPGLSNREFTPGLNQNLFIKQSKDFYLSKGTDRSFEILFKALYNEDVKIVKPRDFLFTPSNADFRVTNDLVVEAVTGDPTDLLDSVLNQNTYKDLFTRAYAPITSVESVNVGTGNTFYKLSIDSGYSRDIGVDGALYGEFSVHPKTQVIGQVAAGATVFDVDSTVGFPTGGELYVNYFDNTTGVVSFTSKSLTQFFGCSNITKRIVDTSSVGINTYAYGFSFSNPNEQIQVRINSVLSNLTVDAGTKYLSKDDDIIIKSLGSKSTNYASKNWIYNVSPTYQVQSVELIDESDLTYTIKLSKEHYLRVGDIFGITGGDNAEKTGSIIDIHSPTEIRVRGQGRLILTDTYSLQRKLTRAASNVFTSVLDINANVQNVYLKEGNSRGRSESMMVSAPSIPFYNAQPIDTTDRTVTFSGTFSGTEFAITTTDDHGFYTGDAVYYIPEISTESFISESGEVDERSVVKSSLFAEGLYFIKRVSSTTVQLAKSRTDIFNSTFVSVSSTQVTNNKIKPYDFRGRTLESQKLLREIKLPTEDGNLHPTEPGFTGVLVNGVEIKNYKSNDLIKYGKLDEIEVVSPGSGYDVVTPPLLNISDSVGTGATGYVAVNGILEEIKIVDPGFDYETTPVITITGGNGSGAKAFANMKQSYHEVSFNSQSEGGEVTLSTSVIGLGTYHKFRNAERIVYNPDGQRAIGGIATNSSYFVSEVSSTSFTLHNTESDAISGINTITFTSFGLGKHKIRSYNQKLSIENITVTDSGDGYQNKRRTAASSGISTSLNTITITNHDYESGEIVKYTAEDTAIGGLTSGTEYYISKVDNNNFHLSEIGTGSVAKEFYYNTDQFVDFTTTGSGTHSFNYQDISVSVVGRVGISSVGTETFEAEVQPVFRGEITSVHLSNQGVGYGSSEIINFTRNPLVSLVSGSEAQLYPVVNDGKIVDVVIANGGKNYNTPPEISVDGDGIGAVLTAVINSSGEITSIKIVKSGAEYTQSETTASVTFPGSGVEFAPSIQNWRINNFEKNFESFKNDDGFVTIGANSDFGLQYSSLYAPRSLRKALTSVDQTGKVLYGNADLKIANNVETSSTDHSPIIGWSYDGYPIYGPYGYLTKSGGVVSQMKSGYKINLKSNRPPESIFPEGFFVEDYTHYDLSDETVLDENNGRFCVTPEFPEGTYAYFATINTLTVDSSGPFLNFKRPAFPYLIGENFKAIPNKFNFDAASNQDLYNLNGTDYLRNTDPYNLIDGDLNYTYLPLPNNLNQKVHITSSSPGTLGSIGISTGGDNYKVGEEIVFDNSLTQGEGAIARVERLKGRSINSVSVATSTIQNVEIVPSDTDGTYLVFTNNPHNFRNSDVLSISGLSTTSSKIEGSYTVGISSNILTLSGVGSTSSGLGTDGVTGIVTTFDVTGNIGYPAIRENDILGIGTEKVQVLNIDRKLSRIRVIRAVDGTVSAAHTVTTKIYEFPKKLTVNTGFKTDYDYRVNRQIYFDPSETVGLGTAEGVGIGTTIFFSNPGAGITQIFIQTKALYIPQHNLRTGDVVTYSPGNGDGIISFETGAGAGTTLTDQQQLFVAKVSDDLIGLSTVKVGLGTTGVFVGIASTVRDSRTLFFSGIGTGVYHSLKTNHSVITGDISRNEVTVSLAATHGIQGRHVVFMDVNPSLTTSFSVSYNDYNRRMIIDPKSFTASGISSSTNTFTIVNHGFSNGQKVIHTATSPAEGLEDNKIYYVYEIDKDNFKLTDTYYETTRQKPSVVGITSASSGTISPINPPLKVYRDSTVEFDVSDGSLAYTKQASSYAAFALNFYRDKSFTQLYDKNDESSVFNVVRTGTVGITTDAKVTLSITKDTPNEIFYKLDPVYESDVPVEKSQIVNDSEVTPNNQIDVEFSAYSGTFPIGSATTNTFTYTIPVTPEKSSYISSTSNLSYETDCTHTIGPISKVSIENVGKNYYSLPGFSTVTSGIGTGAILTTASTNIGSVKKVRIEDIGFNFQIDKTVRPTTALPQIIEINSQTGFESVAITSVGRGYVKAPRLVVFDGKTNERLSDVDIRYKLGDNQVSILKNTFGINNTEPRILPIENTNGVGISTIVYNTSTEDVTVTMAVGFSTADSFPFTVGDKVMVEGTSVGVGSTGKGFNSESYGYDLFVIKSVTENRGGIGSVSFNISGMVKSGEIVGDFDSANSIGRIIPEKFFPIFVSTLKPNQYNKGETVKSGTKSGVVQGWDPKVNLLSISSIDDFSTNDLIVGQSSNAHGVASSVTYFDSSLNTDTLSKVSKGWQTNSGYLNDNLQRVQDSFYYQNFSYSLRSRVDYDTWEDAVGSLNHTLGFRKFSDYQMESKLPSGSENALVVGVSTNLTSIDAVYQLETFIDLNCVNDFDLVKENSKSQTQIVSDQITFSSKVLTDFFESVGNRVLSIDNVASEFNSNPRPTAFSVANTFDLDEVRAQKYITYVKDRRFVGQRQLMIVDLVHDRSFGYINQYGRVETTYDQGSFDFTISGGQGQLQFFPTKSAVNNYDITTLSYNLDDNLLGVGTTGIGPVLIDTKSVALNSGSTSNVVSIASTYSSIKLMIEVTPDINGNEFTYENINIVHDGTNVSVLEYGDLTTNLGASAHIGYGTYHAYISGSSLNVDYIPASGVGVGTTGVINAMVIGIGNSDTTGIGTLDLNHARIEGRNTSIASSTSPVPNVIGSYDNEYDVAHFIVQLTDITNNQYSLSELLVVDDYISDDGVGDTYDTEFGIIETNSGIGTIGTRVNGAAVGVAATVEVLYTPPANVQAQAKVFMVALRHADDERSEVDFTNGTIDTSFSQYEGTDTDIKRAFELKHRGRPIFERYFEGNDSDEVVVDDNTIRLPDHFFVTGEQLTYVHAGAASTQAIGIASTSFVGIGTTDKVPGTVFAVKVDDNKIKLAATAEKALKATPEVLDFTSVGIGTSHRFVSTNQNSKGILALDNIIQSPIVSTALTTHLHRTATSSDDRITVSTGINSIFGGDLLKIENEIVKVSGVGIGSTNVLSVQRQWLGTALAGHSTDSLVTKVVGNYNIVDNILNFVDPPVGQTPLGTSTNRPDERDWTGIATGSSFQGRIFLRSGVQDTSNETYYRNKVLDDISDNFNGTNRLFTLTSEASNVGGISTENAVVLINDIFQGPGATSDYTIEESSGISSIRFAGTATSVSYDVNSSNLPVGGVIVSVGMTDQGLGFQPLVSAGGTATVSGLGTISAISIGNSGSGYRAGVQTVNVGVALSSTSAPSIEFIGTATISNGNIVSVAITNPGTGYTTTNVPYVIFDDPLSYSGIALTYSSVSSGIGSGATIDIVVGQGSSIIDFEIRNTGYGFKSGEKLTVPIGGLTGIPTTSTYRESLIDVQKVFTDEFTAWSLGTLQVLDNLDDLFDGSTVAFSLRDSGSLITIRAAKGSNINVQDVLLVFINDTLQVPGEGYTFNGGSTITFTEAPKVGDKSKIIFYKGTGAVDVVFRDIIPPVKIGDTLQIESDVIHLNEDPRVVDQIDSTDIITTDPYYGPGNTADENLVRPVILCRQTEDKIIDNKEVGKDRELYEPGINPGAYLIKSVGIGSTTIYVDNIRPFFDSKVEDATSLTFQNKVTLVSQDTKTGAAATAIVSGLGTISSISISSGGVGYSTAPTISIGGTAQSVGLGTTAVATASITAGVVTSITLSNAGTGYTTAKPPQVLIAPPTSNVETNSVGSFSGDSGIVVGFGTTSSGSDLQIVLDLHVPAGSFMRDASLVGTAVTISGIGTNDYFMVYNSNVGLATTSISSKDGGGTTIAIGKSYIDNIYQVASVSTVESTITGIGTTHIRRIQATVVGLGTTTGGIYTTSNYMGNYSWGRVDLTGRVQSYEYNFYGDDGVVGITTSGLVRRTNPLKFRNYIV